MTSTYPISHAEDALKLNADGRVDFFELRPISGGQFYFKPDNEWTWLGNTYEALPCAISGLERDTEKSTTPRMTIGQENMDLLPFKGLINDGYLDGATIVHKEVLVQDLLDDIDIKKQTTYRIKRVESYTRTKISLVLATFSGAISQKIPFRQYIPPDFPWVEV